MWKIFLLAFAAEACCCDSTPPAMVDASACKSGFQAGPCLDCPSVQRTLTAARAAGKPLTGLSLLEYCPTCGAECLDSCHKQGRSYAECMKKCIESQSARNVFLRNPSCG